MARKPFKIGVKQANQLMGAIRQFNASVKRLGIDEHYTANYADIKHIITNKRDFNRELNRLKRFQRKGQQKVIQNPNGVLFTRWEINEFKKMQEAYNKQQQRLRTLGQEKAAIPYIATDWQVRFRDSAKDLGLYKDPERARKDMRRFQQGSTVQRISDVGLDYKDWLMTALEKNWPAIPPILGLLDLLGRTDPQIIIWAASNPFLTVSLQQTYDLLKNPTEVYNNAEFMLSEWERAIEMYEQLLAGQEG